MPTKTHARGVRVCAVAAHVLVCWRPVAAQEAIEVTAGHQQRRITLFQNRPVGFQQLLECPNRQQHIGVLSSRTGAGGKRGAQARLVQRVIQIAEAGACKRRPAGPFSRVEH